MFKRLKALVVIALFFLLQAQAQAPMQTGLASYYSRVFEGRMTANGERFTSTGFTAAHRSLPFGTLVEVRTCDDRRKVIVRINDRGPFVRGRVLDLTYRAFAVLAPIGQGVICVKLTVIAERMADHAATR